MAFTERKKAIAPPPHYYIKNPDGEYYRNDRHELTPPEPAWVQEREQASLCSKDRAALLTAFWQMEGLDLEQYEPPEPKKPRRERS